MKKIYVLRGTSYDRTAQYHHYFDIRFFTNKKLAEAYKARYEEIEPEQKYWITTEIVTTIPF